MRSFTSEAMRELDRRTIESGVCSGIDLMEQAGAGLCRAVLRFSAALPDPELLLLAGKGNNGGDVFILARLLAERRLHFRLHLTGDPAELRGDAAEAFRRLPDDVKNSISNTLTRMDFNENTVVVDGLLGTGVSGAVREPFDRWIRLVNRSGCPVVAVDIPSGLNG